MTLRSRHAIRLAVAALLCAAVGPAAVWAAAPAAPQAPVKKPEAPAKKFEVPAVVAQVGDAQVTRDEAYAFLLEQIAEGSHRPAADVMNQIVDELVSRKLVDLAAAKAGKSRDEYVQQEIDKVVKPATDADVQQFYEQNKARMGSATLDQVRPQIVQYLKQQQTQRAFGELVDRLRAATTVKSFIESPRTQVAESGAPAKGPKTAPVTIVEFSDYQCPYCGRAEATVKEVLAHYGDKVRLVFRNYPLSFHANAQKAAEAAGCAEAQGKFWEMHDLLFANQNALDGASLEKYAADLKLDGAAFKKCLDGGDRAVAVRKDVVEAEGYGVSSTPTFFVNGIMVTGALPFSEFSRTIDKELQRLAPPPAKSK